MTTLALFVAIASLATQACLALTVNTPTSIVQCLPVLFQWSGGTPPYYLSLVPAGQPSAPAFKTFPAANDQQFTWKCDLATGTVMNVALRDATGTIAYSDIASVGYSPDSSCVNTAIIESSVGSTSAANSTGSGGLSDARSTGSSTASGRASTATATNGAMCRLSINAAGIIGLLSVIGAAFL